MRVSCGLRDLTSKYKRKRHKIRQRLKEFRYLYKAKDEDIFEELCFCILTPQSKALNCDKAVKELKKSGLLFKGSRGDIRAKLKGIRFPNNKANYLVAARKFFSAQGGSASGGKNGRTLEVKSKLDGNNPFGTRDWLVKNVRGLGYKEASHFLRNIGFGKDMAILDVHILKNLKRYKVIEKIPTSVNKNTYIDIENRMRKFSRRIKIPLQELDLLFWSNHTGFIFK